MASKVSKSGLKKIIKPLSPVDFNADNVQYSAVKINSEIATKWVDISYSREAGHDEKMLVVARNCVIKTFKKADNKDKNGKEFTTKDGKPRKDKYQIFMGLTDTNFIEMINNYEKTLLGVAVENSNAWFNETSYDESECEGMRKPVLSNHPKYGYAIGGMLGREFTCKSKTEDVPDVSDLELALGKGNIIDVCFWFNKIKLNPADYKIGVEINQINIISVGVANEYIASGIKPEEYETGKLKLDAMQQHEKGGKFCKILNEDKILRLNLENIIGRIFKFDKDGQVSYSMSIRLSDKPLREMIEKMDAEIFDLLVANSKECFGSKKTAKLVKAIVKPLYSYSKDDQEKIKKNIKPTFDPSLWIKLYHTDDKGFDNKIINAETKQPFKNTDDLLGKDLHISSLDTYSRHIWFGKSTSINFTLNKCMVVTETTEYSMSDSDKEEETNEETTEAEPANSDNE